MARFCKCCGNPLIDNAIICFSCGVRVDYAPISPSETVPEPPEWNPPPTPEPVPLQPDEYEYEQSQTEDLTDSLSDWEEKDDSVEPEPVPVVKQKKKKPVLAIILIAVLVLVVAVVGMKLLGGPQRAIGNMEAVLNGNFKKVKTLAPEEFWDYHERENRDYQSKKLITQRQNTYLYRNSLYEQMYGDNIKVYLKIHGKSELSSGERHEIAAALENQYAIPFQSVKSAYALKLCGQVRGDDSGQNFSAEAMAVKIRSSWYIIYYNNDTAEVTFALDTLQS